METTSGDIYVGSGMKKLSSWRRRFSKRLIFVPTLTRRHFAKCLKSLHETIDDCRGDAQTGHMIHETPKGILRSSKNKKVLFLFWCLLLLGASCTACASAHRGLWWNHKQPSLMVFSILPHIIAFGNHNLNSTQKLSSNLIAKIWNANLSLAFQVSINFVISNSKIFDVVNKKNKTWEAA